MNYFYIGLIVLIILIYINFLYNLNGDLMSVIFLITHHMILKKIKKRNSCTTIYFTKDHVFKIQECHMQLKMK